MFGFIGKFFADKKSVCRQEIFGMSFNSPVGAINCYDINGDYCHKYENKQLSFIELGPVTRTPQNGKGASKGAVAVAAKLRNKSKNSLYIAANIVKDPETDIEQASDDYEYIFSQLYDYVDIFFINLTDKRLQEISTLGEIVDKLVNLRLYFNDYKPILIQAGSQMSRTDIDDLIHYSRMSGIDGIVATDLKTVSYIHTKTNGMLPVISKASFANADEAFEHLKQGAALVEFDNPIKGISFQKKLIKKVILNH